MSYHSRMSTGGNSLDAIITRETRDVFYIFDMLSDLLHAWATNLMIGDFFILPVRTFSS